MTEKPMTRWDYAILTILFLAMLVLGLLTTYPSCPPWNWHPEGIC